MSLLLPRQIAHHSCASVSQADKVQKHRPEPNPTRRKHTNSPYRIARLVLPSAVMILIAEQASAHTVAQLTCQP